jgi:protein O-mannosyl-transferase
MSARIIGLALALAALLAYLPATHHAFLDYDDDAYVSDNPVVQAGMTTAGVKWAFAGSHVSNWHPVTWLSHMADCEIFRLNPGGHHFVNLLFHATNTSLLFLLLLRLTGARWPAAFVALLFAWHPLHVESVAWIAERKDVLSTCFGLLALLSYERYVRENKCSRYWLSLFFFAVSLMSKPMLVTLPLLLLLLDFWPLQRMQKANFKNLVLEKFPYIFLSAVFCVVTFLTQRHEAVASLAKVPLGLRIENVAVAYVVYLLKTFWPVRLAVFYPLPKEIPWTTFALALAALAALSALAWSARRRQPALLVGWLWYLVTLVPVIGLVQVGDQALADRYTYVPLIGIFLAVTFAVVDVARRFQLSNQFFAALASVVLITCLAVTENQLTYWRDSQTLFTHALTVTRDNALAHLNLGSALLEQHQTAAALAEYRKTLQLDSARREAYNNIGRILNDAGKPAEALDYCRVAVELDPQSPAAHDSLGIVLSELGRYAEALAQFTEALRIDSEYTPAHFQMGRTLLKMGRDTEAVAQLREAVRRQPNNVQMLLYTARVLAADKNLPERDGLEALTLARHATQLTGGTQPVVLDTLALACAAAGHFAEAVQIEQQAIQSAQAGDTDVMRQRLELFHKQQPWRESFAK